MKATLAINLFINLSLRGPRSAHPHFPSTKVSSPPLIKQGEGWGEEATLGSNIPHNAGYGNPVLHPRLNSGCSLLDVGRTCRYVGRNSKIKSRVEGKPDHRLN